MFSSKNIQMNERKNGSKVTRYAIKKLSMGTASVAVALGFMFVQGQTIVHADTVEATSAETTAKWEMELSDIGQGQSSEENFLEAIENEIKEVVSTYTK